MEEKFYRIREVAEMLKLAKSTVRKYLANGKLTGSKIGRIWRISQDDIDAFIAATHSGQSDAGEAKDENRRGKNDSGAD